MFIYIKDIEVEGVEFLAPLNSVVVGVKTARTAIEEVELDEDKESSEGDEEVVTETTANDKSTTDQPAE